jgi:hypothetical protein
MDNSTDPVEVYEAARADFLRAKERIAEIVGFITRAQRILEHVEHAKAAGTMLPGVWDVHMTITDANWPELRQIGEALKRWHDTRAAMLEARAEVPEHLQENLQPLPLP